MAERTTMMDQLSTILPTFPINTDVDIKRPDAYIMLRYKYTRPSEKNSLGSFAYWSAFIYVKANTITTIDDHALRVRRFLKQKGYEVTRSDNGDYYDALLKRYRLEIEYRVPRGEILV